MTIRVLVVEDSTSFRRLLAEALRRQGYGVFEAWSLESARRLLPSVKPAIILLDLQLDDGEGVELLKDETIRDAFTIVISARGGDQDKIDCLSAGADDYIVKPIDLTETLLRIRRLEKFIMRNGSSSIIDFGAFAVDFATRRILHPKGGEAVLSHCEYKLLRLFTAAEGQTISRAAIAQQALDRQHDDSSRAIDVLVSKLRRKLDPTGRASPIRSVRGAGYKFAPQRDKAPTSHRSDRSSVYLKARTAIA